MNKLLCGVLFVAMAALPAAAQGGTSGASGQASGQAAGQASQQTAPPADPIASTLRANFKQMANNLTRSAEEFPDYDKKLGTQPETRTYGALIGHIINANYFYCSQAKGEVSPQTKDYEKNPGTKDEMAAAMHAAIDYCTPLYDALTDASATQMVTPMSARGPGRPVAKIAPLMRNVFHNNEEYGNIVGFFRANNMVPPSTEAAQQGGRRGQ